jgi:hypothetical protein
MGVLASFIAQLYHSMCSLRALGRVQYAGTWVRLQHRAIGGSSAFAEGVQLVVCIVTQPFLEFSRATEATDANRVAVEDLVESRAAQGGIDHRAFVSRLGLISHIAGRLNRIPTPVRIVMLPPPRYDFAVVPGRHRIYLCSDRGFGQWQRKIILAAHCSFVLCLA